MLVPNAVIALRQGAGRLIRDVHDRGVLVLCEVFLVDDIVDPRETRPRLCEFADLAAPRRIAHDRTLPRPRP